MVPKAVIAETAARYDQRTNVRTRHEEQLKTGSPVAADTPARVEKRLRRLAMQEAERAVLAATANVATGAPPVTLLERIIGRNDLISVTFLEAAVSAAGTVARIRIRSGNQTVGYGTGSLVAPRLLLTNNHVLGSVADARNSLAEFNYQDGIQTPTVFALDPDSFFVNDPVLDYAIVAVRERADNQAAITSFGFNRLIEEEGKVIIGEALNIIQHPNGELKQIALRENQLKDVLEQFLHYHTDTAPGSSGSPVFNDQWEIVALHHSGVPRTNAAGQYLTKDGTVWTPGMGEHRIDWVANEGARISRIVAHLKNQALSGVATTLRNSIFDAPESTALTPRRPPTSVPSSTMPSSTPSPSRANVSVAADGTATWTIPVEISVRVGGQQQSSSAPMVQQTSSAPAVITPPPAPPADLKDALDAVENGRRRKYYDADKDTADREAYYAGIGSNLSASALFTALSELLTRTHAPQPSYKPAVHVYPFVDLHPNGKLRSIYSQKEFSPEELVREDFRIEQERSRRLQELLLAEGAVSSERIALEAAALEAQLPFNCEHVVPQSWFDKDEPMRGDIHHLFACESGCNSFRGNIPYFDFPDFEEAVRSECGKREADKFEPGAAKGIVARATLYFLLRYPGQVNTIVDAYDAGRLATLLSWHDSHPVTRYEQHRNMAIFEKQGNRNPLIDHPDWASGIDFQQGL